MEVISWSRLLISLCECSKQLKNMDTLKEKYKKDVFLVGILFNKYLLCSFFCAASFSNCQRIQAFQLTKAILKFTRNNTRTLGPLKN